MSNRSIHGSAQEQAMQRDRAYFAQHPDATSYTRPFIPGEIPNTVAHEIPRSTRVQVSALGPRTRRREFGALGIVDIDPPVTLRGAA